MAGRLTATARCAATFAILAPAGCSLLFTYAEPPEPDASLPDAADLVDAATDAAGSRVPCDSPNDCSPVEATECLCGSCVAPRQECVFSGKTYVRTDGARDCLPAASKIDSAYSHTCVLMSDGAVWCWGNNESRQLGPAGPEGFSALPVRVPRDPGRPAVVGVAVGYMHSCALLDDGGVECWGGNGFGQLGAGADQPDTPTPQPVMTVAGPLSGIEQLTTNGQHTCGLDDDGRVWCWGLDADGQVTQHESEPSWVAVQAFVGAERVAAGGQMTCVVATTAQQVHCWGRDAHGALGRGRRPCFDTAPVLPADAVLEETTSMPIEQAYVLQLGNRFGCAAATTANEIWCWGQNARHAIGDQTVLMGPDGLSACGARENVLNVNQWVREIVAGTDFACALYDNDDLYCWGSNEQSQQGTGPGGDAAPGAITLGGVLDAAAGFSHACAILTDGSVKCWGSSSDYGQVGDGTRVERSTPVDVAPFCP